MDLHNSFIAAKSTEFPKKPVVGYLRSSKEYLTFVQAHYIFGRISNRTLSTLQLTSGENVSRYVSLQMMDILNVFCEQTPTNNLHFSCVFVSSGFWPFFSFFYCVDA